MFVAGPNKHDVLLGSRVLTNSEILTSGPFRSSELLCLSFSQLYYTYGGEIESRVQPSNAVKIDSFRLTLKGCLGKTLMLHLLGSIIQSGGDSQTKCCSSLNYMRPYLCLWIYFFQRSVPPPSGQAMPALLRRTRVVVNARGRLCRGHLNTFSIEHRPPIFASRRPYLHSGRRDGACEQVPIYREGACRGVGWGCYHFW
jgi:hypothetical protein